MNSFKFLPNVLNYKSSNDCVLVIPPEIIDKNGLLQYISSRLSFPNYFGYNWDALYDCLIDLKWIEQKKISLIHDDLNISNNDDLKIYLNILEDVVTNWQESDKHLFEVVFSIKLEDKIKFLFEN
ncbi:hypothetical protein FVB9288_03344 [Flavobacterium sp. CECT 9288]|jgi:RNAse (barnase) inhibitor barstar|uniref:barstar family protein n=1 Tax=Flavobacterium sp. CECT 9288 TaxID=2845819 RepID=UPI001E2DC62D|nr:barstar family protein [Flavobacterium sp. CECT 9288]CAH0337575.1 hypothetical protein FVB9288_03344 [Flavobacterium sp. CECT 9288]